MAEVFVTGGSGFIGRNLIRYLREGGFTVRALARSEAARRAVEQAGAEAISGDLTDVAALERGLRGCELVFHAAASTAMWERGDAAYRANVQGTENLLRAARQAGVVRFIHVGTEAVLIGADYQPLVRVDETRPRTERPIGLYPRTKGLAEALVLAANGPELTTVVVRPRLVWGKDDTSLLEGIVAAVRAGQFRWIGGGRHLTSTTHVTNVCEGLLLAAQHGRGGEIYFITDGEPIEFRSFITALLRTQRIDAGGRTMPLGLARGLAHAAETIWRILPLSGEPPITRAVVELMGREITIDDRKARRELGYQGRVSREAGLAEMAGRVPAARELAHTSAAA